MSVEDCLKRNAGFTLIEVMIGVAILGAVALTFGSVFFQIHKQSAKAEAFMVADNTAKAVQAIFSNRDLCDNALRNSSGGKVVFDPATQPVSVGRIMYTSALNPGQSTIGFTEKQKITPNVTLFSISFAEQKQGFGQSQILVNSVNYNVYTGYVTLTFAGPNDAATAGKSLPQRQIPLVVAVDPNSKTIEYCFLNLSLIQLCQQAGGQIDTATGRCTNTVYQKVVNQTCGPSNSTACPGTAGCFDAYIVDGFKADGSPNCICQEVCSQTPWPVPAPLPGPPAPTPPPWGGLPGGGPVGFGGGK